MNAIETIAQQLEAIPDPTLSARAVDLRDVGQRVLGHLLGLQTRGIKPDKPSIIVSRDLTPSDTVSLERAVTLAFVTAEGGPTSHTAILAKAFGLPAVVGVGEELLAIPDDAFLLVDGNTGEVIVNPDAKTKADFAKRQAAFIRVFSDSAFSRI